MHGWCNCKACIEEWKSRNAYWETDDEDAPHVHGSRRKAPKKVKPYDKCRDSKNHLFVWVKYMQQNYRESKVFSWGYMMNVRYAEPGEFVNRYEFKCVGCGHVKRTTYPQTGRYRCWNNYEPADYEIYETRHLDKYNNPL